MVQCCAKPHNICVESWLIKGRRTRLDCVNQLDDIPEQMNMENADTPEDAKVAIILTNRYVGIGQVVMQELV